MVGDHVLDDLARAHPPAEPPSRSIGAGLLVRDQRLPERPAAPARPGRVVESEAGAEGSAALTHEERPRDHDVAGGISDCRAPEVDDSDQTPVGDEEVRRRDVAVNPDGRAVPRRLERRLPHVRRRAAVDLVRKSRDRSSRLVVVRLEWPATEEVVLPGRRSAFWIDRVEGRQEVGQVDRELLEIATRSAVAWTPSSQPYTDHGLGNPQPGRPLATGVGTGSGN